MGRICRWGSPQKSTPSESTRRVARHGRPRPRGGFWLSRLDAHLGREDRGLIYSWRGGISERRYGRSFGGRQTSGVRVLDAVGDAVRVASLSEVTALTPRSA